jgi:ankyrin repeat protein
VRRVGGFNRIRTLNTIAHLLDQTPTLTTLMLAAEEDRVDSFFKMNSPYENIDAVNINGYTALHIAALTGKVDDSQYNFSHYTRRFE